MFLGEIFIRRVRIVFSSKRIWFISGLKCLVGGKQASWCFFIRLGVEYGFGFLGFGFMWLVG
jgi:hypothetical protein